MMAPSSPILKLDFWSPNILCTLYGVVSIVIVVGHGMGVCLLLISGLLFFNFLISTCQGGLII